MVAASGTRLDELAHHLFDVVVELLYREDHFMRGDFVVGGRHAAPEHVDAPLLSVVDLRCPVVPPASSLPFHQAVGSAETRVLWYKGNTGVALRHVGMLVGRTAQWELWP